MLDRFDGHIHTMYSNTKFVDSLNVPEKVIDRAIELGLKGIAITDHSCVGAHVRCNQYAEKIQEEHPDFKVALGEESYLCDTRDKEQYYYHQIFIAKDLIGHKLIRELSSLSWMNGYWDRGIFRTPILRSEVEQLLDKYGKGHIIASSACLAGRANHHLNLMIQAEQKNDAAEARRNKVVIVDYLKWMREWFDDDFYLEVAPGRSEEQLAVNMRMANLARAFGFKIVCFSDAHYLSPEDREAHKIFLNSKSSGDREVDSFYHYAYLQDNEEVETNLDGTGLDFAELCANSMEIYDKIENYSLFHTQQIPQVEVRDFPKKEKHSPFETLNYLYSSDNVQERYWVNTCIDKLKEKNILNRQYLARLEEEADTMKYIGEKLDTCVFSYPNLMQYCVDKTWEVGSVVGVARGSGGAGLNHYLLGITQIDPIQMGLNYYWRFLNKERVELPDIDYDLSPVKRELFFEKLREERGGEASLVQVCTYGTIGARSAVANAARGYRSKQYPNGIDNDIAQYLSSMVSSERGFSYTLSDMVYGDQEKDRKPNKIFIQEMDKYPGLLDIAMKLEGIIDHVGVHASGCILEDIDDIAKYDAFMRSPSGALITQFSLHDAEYMGEVKIDALITEQVEIMNQCLLMLQEHGYFEKGLTIREIYDRYAHPDIIPMDDPKIWDLIDSTDLLALFQFATPVGGQTVRLLKPRNITELTACNALTRLTGEKGQETPAQRYARIKNDISQWYKEMDQWGLTKDEQKVLEKHFLKEYGILTNQEAVMLVVMDEDICGFTLAEANNLRKVIGKKMMDKIPEEHDKVISRAKSEALGRYVWEYGIKPSMSYSFSTIHGTGYSMIAIQAAYLASYYPSLYWNTAYLRVVSGLEEDGSTNYDKVAKAIGEVREHGVEVSLIDINKSGYLFEPDEERNAILYGMKGLNGVGGEVINQIIADRPYADPDEFLEKTNVSKTVMLSLIKAGAFDSMIDRIQCMKWFISICSEPKAKLTMANMGSLLEKNLVPQELLFEKRLFNFNKGLKKTCKSEEHPGYYLLNDRYYSFFEKHFDTDDLTINGDILLDVKKWDKIYAKAITPLKKWLVDNQEEILEEFNETLFRQQWDRYATGNISSWEMTSLGFYAHRHELDGISMERYGLSDFNCLSEQTQWPITNVQRICGTVIAKNDLKSTVTILTPHSGVVDVKMNRDLYAYYNRRISEVGSDGVKHVIEDGWFSKGTLLIVCGYRRGNMFVVKQIKNNKAMYKLETDENYTITELYSERMDYDD